MPAMMDVELLPVETDGQRSEAGFGTLRTAQGNLPLIALDVRGRVDGLATQVDVSQTFRNDGADSLEATYLFPLPDRLAVSTFSLQVAGRTVRGVLQERGQARATYDHAIRTGQRAAIAEEERPGTFTMRVGNLPAGETAVVRLTLVGTLPCADNEVTFRFPLVVAQRYIPGKALDVPASGSGHAVDTDAVPDAARISPPVLLPGCPNPVRLTLTLDIHPVGGVPISAVRSSLHSVIEIENDAGVRRVMVQAGERLDRDFIVRYRLGNAAVQTALTLVPDQPGATSGVFALTLLPPIEVQHAPTPRDLVFLLDRSGSMSGWKMVTARSALAQIVGTLTPRDRFSILAFDDKIDAPKDLPYSKLHPANDRHRYLAHEYLVKVNHNGGTELAQPLETAAHLLAGASADRERIIVLLTDGQVGNEDQILQGLKGQIEHIRIYTVGIDTAVNEGFLRRLAEAGRGAYVLVESAERLDTALAQVNQHIGTPALKQLALSGDGITLDDVVPKRLPDLFVGASVSIMGRYTNGTAGSIRVNAVAPDGQAWIAAVPGTVTASPAIPAAWARARVRAMEDLYAISPHSALEKALVATSLQYSVLCRFTAFVAVDTAEVVNAGGQNREVTQAVEAAGGSIKSKLGRVRASRIKLGAKESAPDEDFELTLDDSEIDFQLDVSAEASARFSHGPRNMTMCGSYLAAPAEDASDTMSAAPARPAAPARMSLRKASGMASERLDSLMQPNAFMPADSPSERSSMLWVWLVAIVILLAAIVGVWWWLS